MIIDRQVVLLEGNPTKSTTSQIFWQEKNISSKNHKIDNWSTGRIPRMKSHTIDHVSNFLVFDRKMMISTAGRKTQLHHYWWSYGWIGFCSYDSGTMAYSDYSTSAIVRVRASSPAWRYHYNVRLYSIDFRWVLYQILNNVISRVRASSPVKRYHHATQTTVLRSFEGPGEQPGRTILLRHHLNGRSII